jgi:hypothetical protein
MSDEKTTWDDVATREIGSAILDIWHNKKPQPQGIHINRKKHTITVEAVDNNGMVCASGTGLSPLEALRACAEVL